MTSIYIACPAKAATGGPELLHQLCYKLNKLGYDASMYYYGKYQNDPVNDRYKVYNNKFVTNIEDNDENILIVPETNVNLLKNYKQLKKVIWWLSVDNYFISIKSKRNMIKSLMGLLNYNIKNKQLLHLVQSQYAYEFLKDKNISENRIYYISDYLSDVFIKESQDLEYNKEDYVLYNPKKGYEFTKKIIQRTPDIKWKALENLTPKEMMLWMKKSKVYIDFGNHPGKDRIPREAAINDCCIITGKRGSAKFKKDVNIPDEFKFDDNEENIPNIIKKIYELLNKYSECNYKFDEYRKIILNEESVFEKDVKETFSQIVK